MRLPGQEIDEGTGARTRLPVASIHNAAAPPPAPLPVEIAFLAETGVAPGTLDEACRLASRWGVTADEALLAADLIDAETFARALARQLALPLLPEDARADPSVDRVRAEASGILPLAPGRRLRFALAPHGPALRLLLERRSPNLAGAAVTTRRRLGELVREAHPGRLAFHAANALPEAEPDASIRDGANGRQIAALAMASGAAGFGLVAAPLVLAMAVAALAATMFLTMIVLRLAAARETVPTSLPAGLARLLRDDELPVYSVIVALYRERAVLPQLLRALSALDYPPARLDIRLVVEADDAETRAALAEHRLPPLVTIVVAPPGLPRTKPRALNVALEGARGTLVAIYDAEDVPDPLQLRQAAALFARAEPDVACLQARLVIDNTRDSWLTRLFTIEYAHLFDVLNPALARFRLPIALGGTSNHFRADVLRALHGWDAWNVTEDADLGFRLAAQGWRVDDLPSATLEEAPATLRAWLAQRTRWLKGWMQVCVTHSRHPLRQIVAMGAPAWLAMVSLSLGTVATALGFPIFTTLAILAFLGQIDRLAASPMVTVATGISLTIFAAGLVAMLWPPLVALKRRRLLHLAPWLLLLPAYYALMSLAAWRALWELLRAPFRWNKTAHGLARTTRTGALETARPFAGSPLAKS